MPGGLPHRKNKNIDVGPTLNINKPSFNGEQKSQVKFKALRPKMKNNENFLQKAK